MARIVVFGLGPMRWESSTRLFALALRSWHFAATLARAGHDVLLFSMRVFAHEGWPSDKITHVRRGRVSVWSISEHLCHERAHWIRRRIAEFEPDAVVGVNREPSAIAVNFAGELPFWADINGDPMAEAQVKASALGGDWNINDWFRKFAPVLHRADRFSTCSRKQRAALIGQLGMMGRLTAKNDGYEFVSAIAPSIDDDELDALSRIERPARKPGSKFVVLWSGGFNTWTDPDTLFDALEIAMNEARELSFVSTGGGIPGHHVDAYNRFERQVSASRHRDRYHLAGWVQTAELPAYYASAHAAILVDRFSYEGVLGTRTRMLDWLAAALPIVSTRLAEISEELEEAAVAINAPCGDARAIASAILSLCNNPADAQLRGERGRSYAAERLRAQLQFAPLLEWTRCLARAPDGDRSVELSWLPSARLMLQQRTNLVREQLRERGTRETIALVGRFALRRFRNGAEQIAERFGLAETDSAAFEAPAPDAPPVEPPRLAGFQWRERFADVSEPFLTVLVFVDSSTPLHVFRWTCDQVRTQYLDRWNALLVQTGPLSAELDSEMRAQQNALAAPGRSVERVDARQVELSRHRLLSAADWVLLLPSGSLLRPDALAELGWSAREQQADVVYADEQHVDETSIPMPPQRKPEWSPELLLARPYLGHAVLVRSSRLEFAQERVGEWPHEVLIYDALLRATERPCRVVQLPYVLSQTWTSQRASEALIVRRVQQLASAERQAVREALWRRGCKAEVERGARPGVLRIRWPIPKGRILVVVLGAAPEPIIERCRTSLERHLGLGSAEVVVARARRSGHVRLRSITADAKYVVIVDPHVEAFRPDWLSALIEQAARADVAAASPKLLFSNGAVAWRAPLPGTTDGWVADAVYESSELSGACFAGSRSRFTGLDIPVDEVDRRAWLTVQSAAWRRAGYRLLYTPFSFLYTHETNGDVRADGKRSRPELRATRELASGVAQNGRSANGDSR